MESCLYKEITPETCSGNRKETISFVLKQVSKSLIASVSWTQFFMAGLWVGAPTVFIPQMRKEENATIIINEELGSWLYSTTGFAAYPWMVILPLFTKHWGRKALQLATAICSTLSFIILFFSKNPYHILIADVIQGLLYAGNMAVRVLIVVEYVSIKYRGVFLTMKAASFFWGIWLANAIGTYFYWKYIAIIGIICSLYTFIFAFYPESPYWLASKGRIEECRASYRWIHGSDETSEKNLNEIITFYSSYKENYGLIETLKSKEFYKPIILCILAVLQYNFSGKLVCSLYILDIFKKITDSEPAAYSAMLILDGVTVFGMYFGSFLSRIFKRRTLYMNSSFSGVFLLLLISVYLFLVNYSVITENSYVTIALFVIYSLSITCGPMIFSLSMYGEVLPLKFQVVCYIITGMTSAVLFSSLVKITPKMFATFGIHGTFLFYCLICAFCTIYLYCNMPETKNKTHQEIAVFFREDSHKMAERTLLT